MGEMTDNLRRGVQDYGYSRIWNIPAADDLMDDAADRIDGLEEVLKAFPIRENETAEEYVTMVLGWWVTMGANSVYLDT
jgi:hypothetical protein